MNRRGRLVGRFGLSENIWQDLHVGGSGEDKGQELEYHMFFAVVVSSRTSSFLLPWATSCYLLIYVIFVRGER
jgi:hypothetical protein